MKYQYTSSGFKSSRGSMQFYIPNGIKNIIIINIIIFLILELSGLKLQIFNQFGLIPNKTLFNLAIWQPFSYMFLHDGFFHVLLNMLFLWMFGRELEITWGKARFYKYYIFTGLAAGVLNAIINFKYGQRAHQWGEKAFTFKWDTESWYGEGDAVFFSE